MNQSRSMVVRPEGIELRALPWSVRSVGIRQIEGAWHEQMPPRPMVQVVWSEQGAGAVTHPHGQEILLPAGAVSWYYADEPHQLHCRSPWTYRWWTMDRGAARAFLDSLGFRPEQRCLHPGPPPVALFERLAAEVSDPRGQGRAFATATTLCCLASEAPTPADDSLVEDCLALIEEVFTDPDLGVADLARRLGVHRATLHRRCRAQWGMGPGARLQSRRLQAFLAALGVDSRPLAALAHDCGFRDPAYCARLVRRATGINPRTLRGRQHRW